MKASGYQKCSVNFYGSNEEIISVLNYFTAFVLFLPKVSVG